MKTVKSFLGYFKFVFLVFLAAVVIMLVTSRRSYIGPILIVMFSSLALFFMSHSKLKSFSFTAWVFAFVSVSMVYPIAFMTWYGFNLKVLIVPLIQIIMFGMGTTLSLSDFGRVLKMPWAVFIGLILQFTIMPLVGYTLAKSFGFDDKIAAGIVLIGSCPGGVASNLMAFLAGGNVALSVTMTSCSTLVSPLMTPFLMKTLAGEFIEVNFLGMMFSILNMIIVPLAAGLIAHYILYSKHKISLNSIILIVIVVIAISGSVILINYTPDSLLTVGNTELQQVTPVPGLLHIEATKDMWVTLSKDGFVVGFILIGIVAFAQLIVRVGFKGPEHWMDKVLPLVSMVGICFIIAIITARSAGDLLKIGPLLICAGILHNAIGYVLGYWGARAARLSETDCRTVAIEVGLQNGGMASGLAMTVSDIATDNAKVALAPAIFGPWMNISGSVLATWWRSKPVSRSKVPVKETQEPAE